MYTHVNSRPRADNEYIYAGKLLSYVSVHNFCKPDVLNCVPKRDWGLSTSLTLPTESNLHCKIRIASRGITLGY